MESGGYCFVYPFTVLSHFASLNPQLLLSCFAPWRAFELPQDFVDWRSPHLVFSRVPSCQRGPGTSGFLKTVVEMGSSKAVMDTDEQETNEIQRQILAVRALRETLEILSSESNDYRRPRVPFQTERDCLRFINNYGRRYPRGLDSDVDVLVCAFYDLITQHVLHWMPAQFQSGLCAHHHTLCLCITKSRERFVLSRLKEMGVNVVKMRAIIDAAYIMSLETKVVVRGRVRRAAAVNSSLVWQPFVRPRRMNQQAVRTRESPPVICQDAQRSVIVEYINNPVISGRLSPPYST